MYTDDLVLSPRRVEKRVPPSPHMKLEKATMCKLRQTAVLNFSYVTIRFAICHFLLVVLWNRSFISNSFRDY